MFGTALADQARCYLETLQRKRGTDSYESPGARPVTGPTPVELAFLNFATAAPQRHQTLLPGVGTLHDCCEAAPILVSTAQRILFRSLVPTPITCADAPPASRQLFSPRLKRVVLSLEFAPYEEGEATAHQNAYTSAMTAIVNMRDSDEFRQIVQFIERFGTLLTSRFQTPHSGPSGPPGKRAKIDIPTYEHSKGTLEMFQKMILMHAVYFVASVLLGDQAGRASVFLREAFDVSFFTEEAIQHFRQPASVFLVPRRHGKTWFLVLLISLVLATFRGIRVGYTAHIRKAVEPVFEEIVARLRRWFGSERVDHVKGEVISFGFPDGVKSTIVFASSHNTNVSRDARRYSNGGWECGEFGRHI